ncbi:ricin-type beta-trefoil lectin domain protein [Streptomyces mangrovi]|uniref:ricin-type beta-trefoil lectin domain protein n=1 Tax=Streptomyces mangrovi TaxID=1206892 RepID=UPI00399C51A5
MSKDSGKCLSAGRGTDGTQLVLSTCNGSAEQRWDFRPDGTIRSKGLCMDVAWASKENGTAIQVARCSGNPAQRFHLNETEDLVAGIADKCVDVYDGRTADGTPAILWPCTGSANQTWYRR